MFKKLIDILKAHPRKIVFTEGTDPRILEASARLLSGTFLTPVLVGNEEAVRAAAEDAGFNIRGAIIVDPENYENMEAMVAKMVELRKGKMTEEDCRKALSKGNYFGTMLVKMGFFAKICLCPAIFPGLAEKSALSGFFHKMGTVSRSPHYI